jgi:hypothetical protein
LYPDERHFHGFPVKTPPMMKKIALSTLFISVLLIGLLASSPPVILESNQNSAEMGWSVSSAGDLNGDGYSDLLVGAPAYDHGQSDEGAVFVYLGSASGIDTASVVILEGNQAGAEWGRAVAHAGDLNGDGYSDIAVGAPGFDDGEAEEGLVFIYYGSPSGLDTTVAAILQINQDSARFGASLSTAGDLDGDGYSDLIVGAPAYANGQPGEGAVFVYHGGPTGIDTTSGAVLEGNLANLALGISVSTAGDVNADGFYDIVVGGSGYSGGDGIAYLYHGSTNGLVTTVAATLQGHFPNAEFGFSVSAAGDLNADGYTDIVVGAPGLSNGQSNEGAAFIYLGSPAGIDTAAIARLEVNQVDARMGTSVSNAGDMNGDGYADCVVGATHYNNLNGHIDEGSALVFRGNAGGIDTVPLSFEANQVHAHLGISVCSAGDLNGDGFTDIVAGAADYDNGQNEEGAAFVFPGSNAGTIDTMNFVQLEANQAASRFGYATSSAGDVNGDGYSDVLVGAADFENGQYREGAVFVYHGSASGISPSPAIVLESNVVEARFGFSVSAAGDLNRDGYGDIVVGAPDYANGQADEGAAYVYYGGPAGIDSTTMVRLESNGTNFAMGSSVASAGDVNGDGYSDLILGAPGFANGQLAEGAAFIYHGGPQGLDTLAAAIVESNQSLANLGGSVSTAGDLNGDGYADVVAGAARYTGGQNLEGAAFVYFGSAFGIDTGSAVVLQSNTNDARLGGSVSSMGDVNGDGFSDIVAGAGNYTGNQVSQGAAFLYYGGANGIDTIPSIRRGPVAGSEYGTGVSTAGDLNGDGYSDLVVGASRFVSNEGAVYIYQGSDSGIGLLPDYFFRSNQQQAQLGNSVSSAGDLDGDGYSDLICGLPYYENGQTDEGAVWVFPGGEGGNLYRNTRQFRSDLSTPVATGTGMGTGQFGIGHQARSHYGRAKVKLVWAVVPEGQPFPGIPLTNSTAYQGESGSWLDIGAAGMEIRELLAGVGKYDKWRVRVKYHPATMIDGQVFSRWFYGGIQDKEAPSVRNCATSGFQQAFALCDGQSISVGGSTYASSGTYFDLLTNAAGCDSAVTTTLAVQPLPNVVFDSLPATFCTWDDSVALTATPPGGVFSGPGVANGFFHPGLAGPGQHTLSYAYVDSLGCTNADSVVVEVEICTGIHDQPGGTGQIRVYPNPNKGDFVIEGLEGNSRVRIIDLSGRVIQARKTAAYKTEIRLRDPVSGIYFIAIQSGGQLEFRKVVVE